MKKTMNLMLLTFLIMPIAIHAKDGEDKKVGQVDDKSEAAKKRKCVTNSATGPKGGTEPGGKTGSGSGSKEK